MRKKKLTEYKDATGKRYRLGDIVFNPFFGDAWLVERYTKQELNDWCPECEYCFSQYGNKSNYCMDLTEPDGFEIICSAGDRRYIKLRKELKNIDKRINQSLKEL